MAKVRVKMNRAGARELLRDRGVASMLESRMGRALSHAQANAPADMGAYRESLHVDTAPSPSRARARLVAGVPYALALESGAGTLARALDAAGGELS